jgi:hypothetical protein
VFEEANKPIDGMSFGMAIECLKKGERVARVGWNGKSMFLYHVCGTMIAKEFLRNEASLQPTEDGTGTVQFNSHIAMKTADGSVCVGWLASQSDMLSEDWCIIE